MERIKKQYGSVVIDGTEKKYCEITLIIDDNESVSEISLTEQFKLMAKSFWIYLREEEEHKEKLSIFDQTR